MRGIGERTMSTVPTYTRVIRGILKDRGIDADPVEVEDAMKKRHKHGLGGMRAARFTHECVSVAREIEGSK